MCRIVVLWIKFYEWEDILCLAFLMIDTLSLCLITISLILVCHFRATGLEKYWVGLPASRNSFLPKYLEKFLLMKMMDRCSWYLNTFGQLTMSLYFRIKLSVIYWCLQIWNIWSWKKSILFSITFWCTTWYCSRSLTGISYLNVEINSPLSFWYWQMILQVMSSNWHA